MREEGLLAAMNEMADLVENAPAAWPKVSKAKAQALAELAGVALPAIGMELTLGKSDTGTVWLQNQSGHFHVTHRWRLDACTKPAKRTFRTLGFGENQPSN